jgi:alkylation response protein AidB-like acyl-CoA dehydrogenase
LRDTVQAICKQHYDLTVVREVEKSERGYPGAYWQALVESGLTALIVPEVYGGAGMGLLDAVVMYEEVGCHLADSPHFSSAILAARAIELFGNEQQKVQWLGAIASGESIICVASMEAGGGYDEAGVDAQVTAGKISGRKVLVPFANSASHLLVLARDASSGKIVLCLVAADQAGLEMTQQANIASAASFKVDFRDVKVDDACLLTAQDGWPLWQEVMSFGAVVQAAQATGGAAQSLTIAVEYSKTRVQFDKPIGAFQSLSHYMAEQAVEVEGSRTLTYQAAWAYDRKRPWELLSAQSKLQAGDTYRSSSKIGLHIHGGLGYTAEADPQLHYRRAKMQQLLHWDPEFLERRIADLLLKPVS